MAMLTAEQLHAIMPALPASKSAALFPWKAPRD